VGWPKRSGGVSALVTTTWCEKLGRVAGLPCLRRDYMNGTTPYGASEIVYDRRADFGNARFAASPRSVAKR
jgi:hypothetical protein